MSIKSLKLTASQPADKQAARRTVWKMAWPTIMEQCLLLAVGLNEVFLIGHLSAQASTYLGYGSATALAATSLGQFFGWVTLACYNGVGIATTALVARSIGGSQPTLAVRFGRQSLILAFGIGIAMSGLLYLLAPLLLSLLGAQGELLAVGTTFVHTTAFGMPMYAVLVAGNSCLRGSGDTRTPLLIMLAVNLSNVAVAWLFINGQFGLPTLGVQGAALGAVVSWTVGVGLVLARLLAGLPIGRAKRDFRIPVNLHFDWPIMRQILAQGLPTMAEQWTFQIGIFFFARLLVSQGTVTYAAHNTVINIDSISFLPGIGLGIANTVLIGQSLGAGKPEQAQLYALTAYKMGLLFMTLMGATFFFFPEFFLGLLINDPAVVAAATPALRIAGLFSPLVGTGFIITGALRGAGDTRFPLYVRMLTSIGVRVGLAFVFIEVLGLGLVGGRLAMGSDAALLAVLVLWRFQSGKWKTIWRGPLNSTPTMPAPAPASVRSAHFAPEAAISAPDLD